MGNEIKLALTEEEQAVLDWQYRMYGGFKKALWEAISLADNTNLALLAKSFPVDVRGYQKYTSEKGWWPMVQQKAKACGWAI